MDTEPTRCGRCFRPKSECGFPDLNDADAINCEDAARKRLVDALVERGWVEGLWCPACGQKRIDLESDGPEVPFTDLRQHEDTCALMALLR